MKKLFNLAIVAIIILLCVSAETPDFSNPNYDWSTTDWSTITTAQGFKWEYVNWAKVDYKKIDYKIADIYNQPGFDHAKVNERKYLADLGCSGCSFQKNNFDVKFSRNGISRLDNHVTIPGSYPGRPLFIPTEKEILVVPQSGTTTPFEVPITDAVTIETNGATVKLKDGTEFSGKLSFKEGQAYIQGGQTATVNGVIINPTENTLVCQGSCKKPSQSDTRIIFTDKTFKVEKNKMGNDISIKFTKENPYLKIEEKDAVRFGLSQDFTGSIIITNRDNINLIPEVEISRTAGSLLIRNGIITLTIDKEINTNVEKSDGSTSSPVTITTPGFLFFDNGEKYIISNYNEIATVSLKSDRDSEIKTKSEKLVSGKKVIAYYDEKNQLLGYSSITEPNVLVDEKGNKIGVIQNNRVLYDRVALEAWTSSSEQKDYTPGMVSERLYYNYQTTASLFMSDIKITGPGNVLLNLDATDAKVLSDAINYLPDAVREGITSIILYSETEHDLFIKDLRLVSGSSTSFNNEQQVRAFTHPRDGIIRIQEIEVRSQLLYHEGSHVLTFDIYAEEYQRYASDFSGIKSKYDKDGDNKIDTGLEANYATAIADFKKKYELNTGSGTYISSFQLNWQSIPNWQSSSMATYGTTNFYENVAVEFEYAQENPIMYDRYIKKGVTDKSHIQKLALGNEYGFLPDGWLKERMTVAGYSKSCIDQVTKKGGFKAPCIK